LRGMGMTGAAVLAATAALYAGAGRVILSLLSGQATEHAPPDLMQRDWQRLELAQLHVVCGCGGGEAIRAHMPEVLKHSAQLVLDADGLNAVADDPTLQNLLRQRAKLKPTVITPHPLEAARLLRTSTAQVQSNRLQAAQKLAALFHCTVVLKCRQQTVTRRTRYARDLNGLRQAKWAGNQSVQDHEGLVQNSDS